MPDPDRYKVERYDSTLVKSSLSLQFDGTNLTLVGAGPTAKVYPAVSGRPDKKGKFDYSAARQREQNAGPIPAGTYWVRPDEIWSNAWYKVGSRSAWGNFRLTIHPFTTTQTPGRKGGFFIHGGSVAGSAGCIDLTVHIDRFMKDLRLAVGEKQDCQIHLTVRYPTQP